MSEPRNDQDAFSGLTWRERELLVRLDEKTTAVVEELKDIKKSMVTQNQFKPTQMIAFGLVALVMTGVVLALMNSVLTR